MIARLIYLFAGHALCDYSFQNDFIAKGKNPNTQIGDMDWWQILFAHSIIHAGMVLFITHSVWFAIAELIIHFVTDYAKCVGWINFRIDQAVHYFCKILWAIL